MRRWNSIKLLLAVSIILMSVCGCQGGKRTPDEKLVARINSYELTADDFKSKAGREFSGEYFSKDPDKLKSELLEDLIMKNLLIQEAQAQNFDKDKAFMKEIESYWEQALLKLLIKRKTEEFAVKVTGPNSTVKKEKIQKMLEAWMSGMRKRANVKIYEDNLKEIQIK